MRRITEHKAINTDREFLTVITIWEPDKNKEDAKTELPYTLKHSFLSDK